MDSFEPLRAAGLDVTFHVWDEEEVAAAIRYAQQRLSQGLASQVPYFWYANVSKPADHPTYNLSQDVTQEKTPRPLDSLVSNIALQIENRQACYWKIWDYIPGPVHHEFCCHYASLDMLIPNLINYYYGESTIIDDWIVPLNRHPELNPQRVATIITRARPTTFAKLEQHQSNQSHRDQMQWERERCTRHAFLRQYLIIKHNSDPTNQLYLRRDCRAAWIIPRSSEI